jgi:hypothetical protein
VRAFDGSFYTPWSLVSSFTTEPVVTGLGFSSVAAVSVYPNPVVDFARIAINDQVQKIAQIYISNIFGQVVWTAHPIEQSQVISVSLSDIPSGVYFLSWVTEDGLVQQSRLVKQ